MCVEEQSGPLIMAWGRVGNGGEVQKDDDRQPGKQITVMMEESDENQEGKWC